VCCGICKLATGALVVGLVACRAPAPTGIGMSARGGNSGTPGASRRDARNRNWRSPAARWSAATKDIEVQGHRGCRGLRPENTMAAFEHAAALGVDVLELDLGLTRDGVLAVIHDPEIKPEICRGLGKLSSRRVRDLSFAELQTLDCGSRRNPKYPEQKPVAGQRIPRLEQVLNLLASAKRLGANIEIKTFSDRPDETLPPKRFAEVLVPLIINRGLERRVTVQSFDPRALQAVASVSKDRLELAALADRRADFDGMIRATGARILSPRHTELRREDVARFQARKLRVIPWTVNDPARMRELIAWGVDGIITDRPDLLLGLLGRL
jgi:glycerophosphoryl diester phosphodiesterase